MRTLLGILIVLVIGRPMVRADVPSNLGMIQVGIAESTLGQLRSAGKGRPAPRDVREYGLMAKRFANAARVHRDAERVGIAIKNPESARGHGRLAEYYESLSKKYDRASLRPWVPIPADPPLPDR